MYVEQYITPADEKGMRAKAIQEALQDVDIHIDTIREKVKKLSEVIRDAHDAIDRHADNSHAQQSHRQVAEKASKEMERFRVPFTELLKKKKRLQEELDDMGR